jgi:hypothetical protein
LTAGLWVRRIRFVMLAPDPRHHRRFQADPPLILIVSLLVAISGE